MFTLMYSFCFQQLELTFVGSELIEESFGFPCASPILDLTDEPTLVLVRFDQIVEATVPAAKDDILPGPNLA